MYRTIDTEVWDDPWFSDLSPAAKLLFLYVLTNRRSTSCGAFEITIRAIAFETGLTEERIEALLPELAPKVMWFEDEQVIWVRNFFRRQNRNANEKMITNAKAGMARLSNEIRQIIITEYPELGDGNEYPMDTLSIPIDIETVTKKETETVSEQQHKPARARAKRAATPKPIEVDRTNPIWDALAEAVGHPATKTEKADFALTVRELSELDQSAAPEEILAFPTWWYDRFPDAELTHRCFRSHFGKFRSAPRRPAKMSNAIRATHMTDYSDIREEFERNGGKRPRLSGSNGHIDQLPAVPEQGVGRYVDTAARVLPPPDRP